MTILLVLAPFSLAIAALALLAFVWTVRSGQYEDPQGDATRILLPDADDHP
jgi:cbb3-type cytochrome oxidase maturation protein